MASEPHPSAGTPADETSAGGFVRDPPLWVRVLLVVNLLDLTTSVPSSYNNVYIDRPAPLLAVQLVLAVWALLVFVPGSSERVRSALQALPLPPAARWVLVPLFVVQLLFMALKIERYPLTNVGMFTYATPEWSNPRTLSHQLVVEEGDTLAPVSLRRFGDPFFSPGPYLDHQWALILHKYPRHPLVLELARRRFEAQGRPAPEARTVVIRFDVEGWHWVDQGEPASSPAVGSVP